MSSFSIQRKSSSFARSIPMIVFESRSSTKFSRHLIFQTKDPFLDNLAVGKFVNLLLEDIHGCLINHQCPAILNSPPCLLDQTLPSSDSSVFAKNLLATLESRLCRFDKCECIDDYTHLRFRDMIDFIVKKNNEGELTWFCDMGKNGMGWINDGMNGDLLQVCIRKIVHFDYFDRVNSINKNVLHSHRKINGNRKIFLFIRRPNDQIQLNVKHSWHH